MVNFLKEELINQGIIQEGIEKISGIRNVIVHSGGVVDPAYFDATPKVVLKKVTA
ncbi:hypothetical protein LC607_01090 [Nostoc sp. CHAB 5824]|nr:hypothetical protein [Nostoc sp. CHAB 5824]